MVRNMSRYILKSAIEAWRNLKADNMSVICVGLHQLDGDQQFTPFCDLDIHNEIEDRLTVFPREIILVYPQKISVAIPEWDDSIDVQNNEDDEVEEEGLFLKIGEELVSFFSLFWTGSRKQARVTARKGWLILNLRPPL